MKTQRDDDRLKDAFQVLRAEAGRGSGVPDFDGMLDEAKRQAEARPALEVVDGGGAPQGRRSSRRRLVRTGAWASAVLAASVAALLLIDGAPTGDEDFERLVAAYSSQSAGVSSPTSGLLQVPGLDLMRSLPSIGAPVRGINPSDLPVRQASPEEENL